MQATLISLLLLSTYVYAAVQLSSPVVPVQAALGTRQSRTLTLTNNGPSSVNLDSANVVGTNKELFAVLTTGTAALASGSAQNLTISFAPTTLGVKSANLSLTFSDGQSFTIPLRGLPVNGVGGEFEPSLQYILDTFALPYSVGDDNPSTALYHSDRNVWRQFPRGGEIVVPYFQVADPTKPITAEPIAVFGPTDTANSPTVFVGVCQLDSNTACTELYSVGREYNNTINPVTVGSTTIAPNAYASFTMYSRWPAFGTRGDNGRVYQQDSFNTFPGNLPHHVRVFPLLTTTGATVPYSYLLTWEEYTDVVDFQDVIVILTNVRRPGEAAPTTSSTSSSSTTSASPSSSDAPVVTPSTSSDAATPSTSADPSAAASSTLAPTTNDAPASTGSTVATTVNRDSSSASALTVAVTLAVAMLMILA